MRPISSQSDELFSGPRFPRFDLSSMTARSIVVLSQNFSSIGPKMAEICNDNPTELKMDVPFDQSECTIYEKGLTAKHISRF